MHSTILCYIFVLQNQIAMFFSILFAVLMSSFIAFGTTESTPAKTDKTTTTQTTTPVKNHEMVLEEGKYSQLNKKG